MPMPRKPTALKLLDGNPGKRPIDPTPKAPPARPTPPRGLSPGARAEWRHTVPLLDELGVLAAVDRTALEIYCETVATWREATRLLRANGLLVRGDKGRTVKNPAAQIVRDSAGIIRGYLNEFGLTPAARERLALRSRFADDLDDLLAQ